MKGKFLLVPVSEYFISLIFNYIKWRKSRSPKQITTLELESKIEKLEDRLSFIEKIMEGVEVKRFEIQKTEENGMHRTIPNPDFFLSTHNTDIPSITRK